MVLKKVGLTGASGMLGRHVHRKLREQSIEVLLTSRSEPTFSLGANDGWLSCDLSLQEDLAKLDPYFSGVDHLIHCGAFVPGEKHDGRDGKKIDLVNVEATLFLAKLACRHSIPFTYISGAIVYRDVYAQSIDEEAELATSEFFGGNYGASKVRSEQLLATLSKEKALDLTIFRPSSLYGAGQEASKLVAKWVELARADKTIEIKSPWHDAVNLLHCRDLATAIYLCAKNEVRGVFNIASDRCHSFEDIAKTIVMKVGKGRVKLVESDENREACKRYDLDCSKLKESLVDFETLSLREGISRTLDG